MIETHNVSSKPVTKVVVEVTIEHPWWEGDGKDEMIAVESLRDELSSFVRYMGSYKIIDVETGGV